MKTKNEYDYIVIGSGAAGGVIFNELKKNNKDVLLIEQGNYPAVKSYDFYHSLKNFWKSSGYQYATGNIYLPLLQGISVGGSTRINGSIMQLLSNKFLNKLNNFLNLDSNYFSFKKFSQYQNELKEELKFSRENIDGIKNNKIYEFTKKIGWDCKSQLRTALDNRINKNIDVGNSIENLILRKFNKDDILSNFKVKRLILEKNKITGLDCINNISKKKIIIRAKKKVIVCCGAIGSAEILNNSKIKNKNIGKKFSCHLSGAIDSIFDVNKLIQLPSEEIEIITKNEEFHKFASQKVPKEIILSRLPINKENFLSNQNSILSWVYNVSSSSSGILSKNIFGYKVYFDLNESEFQNIKKLIKLISNFLFNLGAEKVYPNIINKKIDGTTTENINKILNEINPKDLLLTASHLFGTCCFGSNSRNGVIDKNFKVYNYDNLFVADSSIFPFPTESNPQLTIMIFAKAAASIILNDD